MKSFIAIFLVLIICMSVFIIRRNYLQTNTNPSLTAIPTIAPSQTPKPHIFQESALWFLIQDWRAKNGLKPYIENQNLCTFAEKRTLELSENNNHSGYWKWENEPYLSSFNTLGENISSLFLKEKDVLQAWLHSPTHLKNLEAPFTYSCLKCNNLYCSHIFGNM